MRLPRTIRSLTRESAFASTAALTLALGIGLSTAVFTVAEALLVRALPVRDQDRVLVLWAEAPDRNFVNYPLPYAHARAFARGAGALERAGVVSYHGAWPVPIRDGDRMTRLRQALVSGDFFDVLGVRPVHGRTLRAEDDRAGAAPVTVVSHDAWQRLYGGDSAAVGNTILEYGNGKAHTIVGIMPQGLDYPRGTDFWIPIVPARTKAGSDSTSADVHVVGRLRRGASASAARDELTAFFRAAESPWQRNMRGFVSPLPRLILGDVKPAVIAFSVAAGLLLLITCINVANLLLVRGLARLREMAVRSALGASRRRIIGQLVTENAALAIAGGALGVLVAAAAIQAFIALAPASVPRLSEIQMSATAFGGAVLITGMAMLLFGLAPAVMTSRVELQQALRTDSRHSTRSSRVASEVLVVGQVALAVLVLSAAGLIVRSLVKLERADLALEPSRLLIGELAFRYDAVDTPDEQRAILDAVLPAVRAIPGVLAASPVVAMPFAGPGGWDGRPASEGQSADEASRNPILNMEVVDPDYFAAMGMSILRGRAFTEDDREGAPRVVMLSAAAARYYWPDEDPIGKRLQMGRAEHTMTVVGIVPDTRYRDLRNARPSVYFPLRQPFFPFAPLNLVIRTSGRPADLVPALRRAIGDSHPAVALATGAPFESYLDGPLEQPRLNALLLAIFAAAAVALAAIGLFGVMATMVRQRTRELGVRMALGATAADMLRLVMRRGLVIAAAGLSVGLVAALVANRLLSSMLYDVQPSDAMTLVGVAFLLLAVAVVATAIPARASTRIDPALALRVER